MDYYLYRHTIVDSTNKEIPFYIGIATKYKNYRKTTPKSEYYIGFIPYGRNDFWKRTYNKYKSSFNVDILYESDSREEIIQKEIEFIKLYGKTKDGGTLVNMTDGGEGASGHPMKESTKKILSEKNKGRKQTEEAKRKISAAKKGKKRSPEYLAKMYERIKNNPSPLLGRKFSDEHRKNMVLSQKSAATNPDRYKKLCENLSRGREIQKNRPVSKETREKRSKASKGRVFSEEHRRKIGLKHKGKKNPNKGIPLSEEHRQKIKQALLGKKRPLEVTKKIIKTRLEKGIIKNSNYA